jgi:hypothetical protein
MSFVVWGTVTQLKIPDATAGSIRDPAGKADFPEAVWETTWQGQKSGKAAMSFVVPGTVTQLKIARSDDESVTT